MHYAWLILFCCCMVELGSLGIINCVGLFLAPVCADLGVGATDFSLYLSFQMLSIALTAAPCGKIIQKIEVKKSLLFGAVLTTILFYSMGLAQNIIWFYIMGILFGPALNLLMMLPVPILITRWFKDKRGFAMGLAMTFGGVGGVIFSIVLSGLIETMGWRTAYFGTAILVGIFTLPWIALLLKNTPQEKNLLPYGAQAATITKETNSEQTEKLSLKDSVASPAFWATLLFAGLIVYVSNYVTYLSAHGTSIGLSTISSGLLVSVAMIGEMIGALALGSLVDRIGIYKTIRLADICIIWAFAVLMIARQNFWLLFPAAVIGLATAMYSTLVPIFAEYVFGAKNYEMMYSYVVTGMMLINAIGLFCIGWLYDMTKSYFAGFCTAILSYVIVLIIAKSLVGKKKIV